MIDSHCHLFYKPLFENIEQILKFAHQNGVDYFVSVCTNTEFMERNIEIANTYNEVFCSVGIHPMEFYGGYDLNKMKYLINKNQKIIAIGEVGLDFHYNDVEPKIQWQLFDDMLNLAKVCGLPVILHCRECFSDELFALLRKYQPIAVFHCFSDSLENAKRVIREGYMLSLTGIVTFKNCGELKEIAKFVPVDRLLLETDSPYLAPVPFRGRANEPVFVRYVAECIANIREIDIEELSTITDLNFFNIFPRALNFAHHKTQ